MEPMVDPEQYKSMLHKYTEATDTIMKNVYTDLEAIESRLDDRIDGIEHRSDEAIKSLAKVLAEELGAFCRREISERLGGHAADWQEEMNRYEDKLSEFARKLDSARERGTGGVQDCMKLLTELQHGLNAAEERRKSVSKNIVASMDLTDESVDELTRRVEKLEQGKIDSVSPALRGSIPARLGKPVPLTNQYGRDAARIKRFVNDNQQRLDIRDVLALRKIVGRMETDAENDSRS